MSSGGVTGDIIPLPSATTDVQGKNALAVDQVISRFKDGLKSLQDFEDFLKINRAGDDSQRIQSNVLQPMSKTTGIRDSEIVGDILKKTIYTALHANNTNALKDIIAALRQIAPTKKVIHLKLRKAVGDIKRMAKANNNDELGIAVKSLIHDWKMMHNRSNEDDQSPSPTEATPTILKEPSTTASHTNALVISKEPPSTAETSKITLAISKEPPPLQQSGFTSTATKKPRAIVDYNFLSSMAGNKAAGSSTVKFNNSNGNSTTTVRPDTRSFDIGNLVESLSGKNKGKNIVNTTSLQSKRNSDYLSDPNLYQDTQPKKIRKLTKRVQFKSNLTDVRYFTRDMDEWNALFNHLDSIEQDIDIVPRNSTWRCPCKIVMKDPVPLRHRITTPESTAQQERESKVLQVIYTQPHHIPPSPAEPDEPPMNVNGINVPIIPLEDVDSMSDVVMTEPPLPPPPSSSSSSSAAAAAPVNISQPSSGRGMPEIVLTATEIEQLKSLAGTMAQQLQSQQQQQQQQQQQLNQQQQQVRYMKDTRNGPSFGMAMSNNAIPSVTYQQNVTNTPFTTVTNHIPHTNARPIQNYNAVAPVTPNTTTSPMPKKQIDIDQAIRNDPGILELLRGLSSATQALPQTSSAFKKN